MSLLMNSSGERPVRPSHSGTQPAPGATRSGGAIVERRSDFLLLLQLLLRGANAVDGCAVSATMRAADAIFMILSLVLYYC